MMIPPICVETVTVSLVKVEERGKKAVFENLSNLAMEKVQMDGCVIKNSTAADWVIRKPGVGTIIVELKGTDVEHGAKQVEATASFLKRGGHVTGKMAGLIVAQSYPKASSAMQKAQTAFFSHYKGPLHVVTRNAQYSFEKVLSADGPF